MMSWRSQEDLGTQIVAHVHQALKVTEGWSTDFDRGFTWWPQDFSQTIWADVGLFQNAQNMFRVHAETDLIVGRGHAQDFELALTQAMHDASMSSVVYDSVKDTYKLSCSVYASADNEHFMDRLFMAASAIQLAEAQRIGHKLAQSTGASPAVSGHPKFGLRGQPDPMVHCIETFFAPNGVQPSRWIGQPEWKHMEWAMERQASSFVCDHHSKLSAELHWGITAPDGSLQASHLEVLTEEMHPLMGHGLFLRLKLPIKMSPEKCAHAAVELNNLERKEWLRCHFLGSWCVDDGALEFETFVPNTSYHSDVLETLSLSMAIRAEWASEQFLRWLSAARG